MGLTRSQGPAKSPQRPASQQGGLTKSQQGGLTKLQAARYTLARSHPYLSAALWAVRVIEVPGMLEATGVRIGVDEYWRLYYDPDVVEGWSTQEMAGVLYHEICHLLRDHAGRARDQNVTGDAKETWNIAADMEINDDLDYVLPSRKVMPADCGFPSGLLAEQYYRMLLDKKTTGATSANINSASANIDPTGVGSGRCGSCAHGVPEDWENSEEEGMSPAHASLLRRKVANDIKAIGSAPGDWKRWADEVLDPKVDWRTLLAACIRRAIAIRAGVSDYSYCRPSRRQHVFPDVVLPSMVQQEVEVAVVIDTSGSMGDDDLGQAMAETRSILRTCGASGATVLCADADVSSAQRVFDPDKIKLIGGGGTDMRVGIAKALELHPRPDVIIVLTDGYTPWPERRPAADVIVCLVGKYHASSGPEWARVVHAR